MAVIPAAGQTGDLTVNGVTGAQTPTFNPAPVAGVAIAIMVLQVIDSP